MEHIRKTLTYNPYQHASHLGINIIWAPLSPTLRARYDHETRTIFLRENLTTRVAYCTLAHEIVHAEFEDDDRIQGQDWEKIEKRCDIIAAQRLISWPQLVTTMPLSRDPRIWCSKMLLMPWVLKYFFLNLTPEEHAELEAATGTTIDKEKIIQALENQKAN